MIVRQKKNGITLIALVVTIVVLLILAGASIAMLVGENGIINKAKQAKRENLESQLLEELKLKVIDIQIQKQGEATLQDIVDNLKSDTENEYIISLTQIINPSEVEEVTDVSNNTEIYVIYKNYQFKIDDKKEITLIGKMEASSSKYMYAKTGLTCYLDTTLKGTKEENVWKDASGNGINATLHGCQWNENGLYFDGVDDYASLGNLDYGNYTLEVICETPTLNASKVIIGNVEAGGYSIETSENNQFESAAYINGKYDLLKDSSTIEVDAKYKITATCNGREHKMYINGELKNSSTTENGLIELPDKNTIMIIRSKS